MTGVIHRFRGEGMEAYDTGSGKRLRSALDVLWIDVDWAVDGDQEGAMAGYNPKKKGQKSYHPLMAFVSEAKEVLHSWFRCGSAYTGNGVVEFMKECMVCVRKRVKVLFRGDSGFLMGHCWTILNLYRRGI